MEVTVLEFKSIIGHDNIKLQILNSIESGTFTHAHIFQGEDGIGKSLVAHATALKILDKEKDRQYADIIEFRIPGNRKTIGVNEIRLLVEEINKKPVEGDKKVIIIYEAHSMTMEAQNAFLKTIEEPPPGIYIILLSESLESILDTIKSRCQIYKFYRLSEEDMNVFLKRTFSELTEDELKPVAAFSDGIPGRAERFIKDKSFKEIRDTTCEILMNLREKGKEEILKYEDFLQKYKNEWQEVLTWFLSYVRDVLIYKETGKHQLLINIDKIESIKDMSETFSFNQLNDIIDIIKAARDKLERNVNSALVFDYMLLKMQET